MTAISGTTSAPTSAPSTTTSFSTPNTTSTPSLFTTPEVAGGIACNEPTTSSLWLMA